MGYINDGFGWRIHPIKKEKTWHNGVDYTTSTGVPITTNVPMTVENATVQNGYGNIVTLRDDSGNTYKFAHLDKMEVKKGETIPPGTLIGTVGNTGGSTGSHLHFEAANAAGKTIDPNTINPATGKLWSDVAGFKPGQTLNESIKDSDSDKTKFSRPRTDPRILAEQNRQAAEEKKKKQAEKKLKELKEQQDRKNNQTGPGSNPRPRPQGGAVGILDNPRWRNGD